MTDQVQRKDQETHRPAANSIPRGCGAAPNGRRCSYKSAWRGIANSTAYSEAFVELWHNGAPLNPGFDAVASLAA